MIVPPNAVSLLRTLLPEFNLVADMGYHKAQMVVECEERSTSW